MSTAVMLLVLLGLAITGATIALGAVALVESRPGKHTAARRRRRTHARLIALTLAVRRAERQAAPAGSAGSAGSAGDVQ